MFFEITFGERPDLSGILASRVQDWALRLRRRLRGFEYGDAHLQFCKLRLERIESGLELVLPDVECHAHTIPNLGTFSGLVSFFCDFTAAENNRPATYWLASCGCEYSFLSGSSRNRSSPLTWMRRYWYLPW